MQNKHFDFFRLDGKRCRLSERRQAAQVKSKKFHKNRNLETFLPSSC
jgi:hypothetical protein